MSRKKGPKKPYSPNDIANRFSINYGANFLETAGPYIPAAWTVPESLARHLDRHGLPIPEKVAGDILLDTGAQRTCISERTATQLNLEAINRVTSYGAGGESQNDVVAARLVLGIKDHRGTETAMWWEGPWQVVPRLEEHPERLGIMVDNRPARLIGILGRDILRRATVTYNGRDGKLQVIFDRKWIKNRAQNR